MHHKLVTCALSELCNISLSSAVSNVSLFDTAIPGLDSWADLLRLPHIIDGDGLIHGVEFCDWQISHWSSNLTNSLGVGPPRLWSDEPVINSTAII